MDFFQAVLELLFNAIFGFLEKWWGWVVAAMVGLFALIGVFNTLGDFISRVLRFFNSRKKRVGEYCGSLDEGFVRFIYENLDSVFKLNIQLAEEESAQLSEWLRREDSEPVCFFSIKYEDVGMECGFEKGDQELSWNTRFWDSIHTEGYFKVKSLQGPYQGWMSVVLKGVGMEHVSR